jgi:calcineurin-like phosphoesterase family protein
MTTWFTSDPHFGHSRIVELCHRPFATVTEMDDALVHGWNERVKPTDTVFVLGDVVIPSRALVNVARLNGRKILKPGNHDACHPMHRRAAKARWQYLEAGFNTVLSEGAPGPEGLRLTPGGTVVNLSPVPYRGAGDHTLTERYSEWRLVDEGRPLVCGHVHDAWRVKRTDAGTLMVNVGVDVWDFAPVSAEQLEEVLGGGGGA